MSTITIKEQQVSVEKSTIGGCWQAVIRDGGITEINKINDYPTIEHLYTYVKFLKEVTEAIKNTAP